MYKHFLVAQFSLPKKNETAGIGRAVEADTAPLTYPEWSIL